MELRDTKGLKVVMVEEASWNNTWHEGFEGHGAGGRVNVPGMRQGSWYIMISSRICIFSEGGYDEVKRTLVFALRDKCGGKDMYDEGTDLHIAILHFGS